VSRALPALAILLGAGAVALVLLALSGGIGPGGAQVLELVTLAWAALLVLAAVAAWRHGRRREAAERAMAESEARLYQAQKMDAVGRLAGGIAHDINNYLAGIRTHCELLLAAARRGALDPEATARRLEAIVGTVLKASSLIERLLTFGRRQAGLPEVVDLNEVVETFAGGLGGGLGPGVTLETRLAPDLWPVEIDLSQVEQALANLVVNARDALLGSRAAGDGDGRIVVSTANRPGSPPGPGPGPGGAEPGDRVCLSVEDDGPGIPAAIRDKIFDPFFSTKETSGASGLGLATVYAVVDEAGGSIEVESREPSGTTVRLLLPRAAPGSTGRARVEPASDASAGARILLVDDEPEVRAATRELLAENGYRVAAADGADRALAAAAAAWREDAPFDLVVTDVRIGEQAGPDLVARLRELGPVRALYMSGYTDRIALRTGPGRGDAFFLKKPFSGEGLLRMVRELLDEPVR